jgi:hypothetical protein
MLFRHSSSSLLLLSFLTLSRFCHLHRRRYWSVGWDSNAPEPEHSIPNMTLHQHPKSTALPAPCPPRLPPPIPLQPFDWIQSTFGSGNKEQQQ